MFHLNTNKFNRLSKNTLPFIDNKKVWLETKTIKDDQYLTQEYENILRKFQHVKKWVVLINPEKKLLTSLTAKAADSKNNLDMSKVLCIYANKVKVDIDTITRTLCQGNCASIILCNPSVNRAQLHYLSEKATQGRTPCYVLMQEKIIH